MLREEQAIGSYINIEGLNSTIINEENRKFTVQLIQALHQVKNYKIDTLYLAISIADRYLVNLVIRFADTAVDFSALAVASLFVAAKIEQPFRPSLDRLVSTVNSMAGYGHLTMQTREKVAAYEHMILIELEFSLHFISPLVFLDRFERIFGVDENKEENRQIRSFGRHMCLFTQRDDQFLNFKPSQLAAACLILAVNLSSSHIVSE